MRGFCRGGGLGRRGAEVRSVEKSSGGALGSFMALRALFFRGCAPSGSSSMMGSALTSGVGSRAAAAAAAACCLFLRWRAARALALDARTLIRPPDEADIRPLLVDGALSVSPDKPRLDEGVPLRLLDAELAPASPSSSLKTKSIDEMNVASGGDGLAIVGESLGRRAGLMRGEKRRRRAACSSRSEKVCQALSRTQNSRLDVHERRERVGEVDLAVVRWGRGRLVAATLAGFSGWLHVSSWVLGLRYRLEEASGGKVGTLRQF